MEVSPLASPFAPFTGVGGGGDPPGGFTSLGFSIPQGSPGELESAARSCTERSFGLSMQGQGIGQGTRVAVDAWQGEAQAAFAAYATETSSVVGANADAFAKAGAAIDRLADDLARAQKATRQAASDCQTYQEQLTAAQQAASEHAQTANNLSQQAAVAAHPHAQAQLNQQAQAAADQAQAAQGQANRARDQFEAAQKQGRDADRAYQEQAQAIGAQIRAAGGEIRTVPRLPGGAPIPISVTAADVNAARRMLRGAGSLANAAKAAGNPALLRRLAGGHLSPAAAAEYLAILRKEEEDAPKPEMGSIIDGLGGLVHGLSLGMINFGNPNTARYRGGSLAADILPLPDTEAEDAARIGDDGVRVAEREVDVDAGNFAQKSFRETFDDGGKFAGQTVQEVADKLRSGELSPQDVPVEAINRDGNTLILNTRSAQALERAGIPRSEWNVVNSTGEPLAEGRLSGQLARNKLDSSGVPTVRPSRGPQ